MAKHNWVVQSWTARANARVHRSVHRRHPARTADCTRLVQLAGIWYVQPTAAKSPSSEGDQLTTTIDQEIAAYEAIQARLELEHMGEWVVMRDRGMIGCYKDAEAASAAALEQFGRGPYLIRQIGAQPLRLPVSVIYHQNAD